MSVFAPSTVSRFFPQLSARQEKIGQHDYLRLLLRVVEFSSACQLARFGLRGTRGSGRTPIREGTSSPCSVFKGPGLEMPRAQARSGVRAAHRATDWHPQERERADAEAAREIECCDETR